MLKKGGSNHRSGDTSDLVDSSDSSDSLLTSSYSCDSTDFTLRVPACLDVTHPGGQGLHHGRRGHHLPGVCQEEADGGHCRAVGA